MQAETIAALAVEARVAGNTPEGAEVRAVLRDAREQVTGLTIDEAIVKFVGLLQDKLTTYHTEQTAKHNARWTVPLPVCVPVLTIEMGRRYARIVRTETGHHTGRSVHCFIDVTNGDILKAASFKAPAKHARGNIFNENALEGVGVYGAAYL